MPCILRTDRDRLFISNVWTHFCHLTNVSAKYSAPFEHQQIGSVECANRHVEQLLRAFVKDQDSWSDYLSTVEFVYNAMPSERLGGISPFQAVLGWNPRHSDMSFGNFEGLSETMNDAQQCDKIQKYVIKYLLRAQDKAI